jgi:hypothetical protein
MRKLALFRGHGGERRYLLSNSLAAAAWTDHATLFEIRDVKNLGKLLVAIHAEKNVVRHGRFLLHLSSLLTS